MAMILVMGIPSIIIVVVFLAVMVAATDHITSFGVMILVIGTLCLIAAALILAWNISISKHNGYIQKHFPIEEVEIIESPRCG